MGSLNKGEIGQPLRINFNEDISAATPTMIMEPELGTKKEFAAIIPSVDVIIGTETLLADQYVEYTTISESDLDYAGRWRYKAKLDYSSTDIKQSNYSRFTVLA